MEHASNAKQGSKTFLATDRLEAIWDQFGRKLLSNIIKMNLKWFCTDDPDSQYKAVQCTVDQCRTGIARKTGCSIEEAQLVALGLCRLRVWSGDFRANKYNFIFTDEKIGSRRSLITREIEVESLPEMLSVAMQKQQNIKYRINTQIRDWYDSMGEERRELLDITEWQCQAANWLGDREYMLAHFRDGNTRVYMDVHCSPNSDATSKNLVDYAEARTMDDKALQVWSDKLNKEWGVNLNNCDDIWKDRDELIKQGTHERAIGNALRLMNARDTGSTTAIARVDRHCALGQEQGMFSRCQTTCKNTNVIWSGQLIDPWMKVTDTTLKLQPWIRKHFEAMYYRALSKKPGTPSGYHSGLSSATKAIFDAGDDTRDDRAIVAASSEDLLAGSKPWVRDGILSYHASTGKVNTNRNVWDTAKGIAKAVRAGLQLHLPGSKHSSVNMEEAVKKLSKDTSWVTATGYTRHYNPWIYSDEVDEATQKQETVSFETTVWSPRWDSEREVSCSLISLVERELNSVLWALPCACFTVERAAEDHKVYNAPFPMANNHDEQQVSPADLSELPDWNTKGFIFSHFATENPLEQIRKKADLPMKYLGDPIRKDEISKYIAG